MKKLFLNLIAGFLILFLVQGNYLFAQESLPEEGYEPSLESCCDPIVAGDCHWVVKCRPSDTGSCSVSSQIPCS